VNPKSIYSDNPEKTLWWMLAGYKNIDKVSEEIISRHSSSDNAKKQAKQIKHCLEQAEEYFQAASVTSIATQPLVLYYGMVSLSWALVLYKATGDYALDRLNSDHLEHGLSRPLFQYSSRHTPLPDLLTEVETTVSPLTGSELRGTFGLLAQHSRLEPSSALLTKLDGTVVVTMRSLFEAKSTKNMVELAGRVLSLKDFFFQTPDMGPFLSELGIRPSFAVVTQFTCQLRTDNSVLIDLMTSRCNEAEINSLEASFRALPGWIVRRLPSGVHARLHYQEGRRTGPGPIVSETVHGHRYIYLPKDDLLPDPARFLGAMFLLGMLVRYFPHVWMHFIDNRHPIVDAVEAFLPIAKRTFPTLILNNLTGDSFRFSQPHEAR